MKYELWYNWEYAQEHNPPLMQIGTSGGFGCTRASMMAAVKGGDRLKAGMKFWMLVKQYIIETYHEYALEEGRSLDSLLQEFFTAIHHSSPGTQFYEYKPFLREAEEGSIFDLMLNDYLSGRKAI